MGLSIFRNGVKVTPTSVPHDASRIPPGSASAIALPGRKPSRWSNFVAALGRFGASLASCFGRTRETPAGTSLSQKTVARLPENPESGTARSTGSLSSLPDRVSRSGDLIRLAEENVVRRANEERIGRQTATAVRRAFAGGDNDGKVVETAIRQATSMACLAVRSDVGDEFGMRPMAPTDIDAAITAAVATVRSLLYVPSPAQLRQRMDLAKPEIGTEAALAKAVAHEIGLGPSGETLTLAEVSRMGDYITKSLAPALQHRKLSAVEVRTAVRNQRPAAIQAIRIDRSLATPEAAALEEIFKSLDALNHQMSSAPSQTTPPAGTT